jgi:alpha-L-fucosidase
MSFDYRDTPGDTDWFIHDRFGMFIHWGVYAAAGRHEWLKKYEQMTDEQYQPYFDHFDPDLYDPAQWACMAREAGMKYFVITTKHHDGCCMWDTALTDWKVTNTPAGRDLIAPMVEAFRAEGLKVGFYHSLIDWTHSHYTLDGIHPRATDDEYVRANQNRDWDKYVEFLHGCVRELLSNYGRIDYLFFDYSYSSRPAEGLLGPGKGKDDWHADELIALCRELQPGIVINDRTEVPQDVTTPEQVQTPAALRDEDGKLIIWESCQTFSGSWGYYRDQLDWKSPETIIKLLIDGVSKGGNMLFNVGPNGRGQFEPRAVERLQAVGEWMSLNGRSIYGCGPCDLTPPPDARFTRNAAGDRLYLHMFSWPFKHIWLPGLAPRVDYAQLLSDGSELNIVPSDRVSHRLPAGAEDTLVLEIPVQKPSVEVPVIELFLK